MRCDNTKSRIANCFLKLLKEKSYDDISVGDVAAAAKISRQAFYYHFSNLFDVCSYIVKQEVSKKKRKSTSDSLVDELVEESSAMTNSRNIVMAIYNSRNRDQLEDSIFKDTYNLTMTHIKRKATTATPEEIETTCQVITYAYTGVTMGWIKNGMPDVLPDISNVVKNTMRYAIPAGPAERPEV